MNLQQNNIPHLIQSFHTGELQPFDYIQIIEKKFDAIEPNILAFLPESNRFERLKEEATSLLLYSNKENSLLPLAGLPIGVKDIFHVDGFETRAGSQLPPEELTGKEAESVLNLKKLGGLIFGKTITTEFAYFAPGPTRNPQNPMHTPGGSSSGSAAAVAAGLVPFAFGSQTIGSIIRPASFCGVVGFKPTYDRISKSGVIPLAPSVDTVGYFTADISSAQYMAPFLLKGWHEKIITKSKPVLGIPLGPFLALTDDEMHTHFERVSHFFGKHDYQIVRIPIMDNFEEIAHRHKIIVAKEASQVHQMWFDKYEDRYHLKTSELITRGQNINTDEYVSALRSRNVLRNQLTDTMKTHGIDLWLSPPAKGDAPLGLESTGDPVMNLPWTHCGFPTLNIPAGISKRGLPMGLQVTAGWNQDEALLEWGLEMEKLLNEE